MEITERSGSPTSFGIVQRCPNIKEAMPWITRSPPRPGHIWAILRR